MIFFKSCCCLQIKVKKQFLRKFKTLKSPSICCITQTLRKQNILFAATKNRLPATRMLQGIRTRSPLKTRPLWRHSKKSTRRKFTWPRKSVPLWRHPRSIVTSLWKVLASFCLRAACDLSLHFLFVFYKCRKFI